MSPAVPDFDATRRGKAGSIWSNVRDFPSRLAISTGDPVVEAFDLSEEEAAEVFSVGILGAAAVCDCAEAHALATMPITRASKGLERLGIVELIPFSNPSNRLLCTFDALPLF